MFCPSEKLALLVTSVMNNDLSNQTDSPHGARNNAGAYAICNAKMQKSQNKVDFYSFFFDFLILLLLVSHSVP